MDFNNLWERYELELTNFVSSRLYDKSNTQDVMQELALKIYKNIDSIDKIDNIRAWLLKITRNTLIDFYKKNSKKIPTQLYNIEFTTQNIENEQNEIVKCIQSLTKELKQSDRDILDLSIDKQYSMNEIANKLDLSKDGAKSKLKRAKSKVADKFFSCCSLEKDALKNIIEMKSLTDTKCHC